MTAGEEGFSILEVLVAVGIGMVILTLAMVSIVTFMQTGYNGVAAGQANDKAEIALTLIRRQLVNAEVVYNPATEGSKAGSTIPAGFSLRILTVGASTTAPPTTDLSTVTTQTCIQWRLKTHLLQDRSWPTGHPTTVRPWHTVATTVRNAASTVPFALDLTGSYGHRVLKILIVLPETTKATGTTLSLKSSITALDAQFFAPTASQYCSPVPSP